jgi:hypothetical protein
MKFKFYLLFIPYSLGIINVNSQEVGIRYTKELFNEKEINYADGFGIILSDNISGKTFFVISGNYLSSKNDHFGIDYVSNYYKIGGSFGISTKILTYKHHHLFSGMSIGYDWVAVSFEGVFINWLNVSKSGAINCEIPSTYVYSNILTLPLNLHLSVSPIYINYINKKYPLDYFHYFFNNQIFLNLRLGVSYTFHQK